MKPLTAYGTGSSVLVDRCQVCDSTELDSTLFLGYLPPVNLMHDLGERPREEPTFPAELLRCRRCTLIQIGLIVDPQILFPPTYPYTSGTTRILRENFAELSQECHSLIAMRLDDLVIDIGSNDGTLLANFADQHRVLGIEPTNAGRLAVERGIPTVTAYFTPDVAQRVTAEHGPARVITATNVFAHMEDIHALVDAIVGMLSEDGIFVSESHYVKGLIETLQYDTIYHEHLRFYSIQSLRYLLESHGLEVFHVKQIPTHGGSIRVYAARKGTQPVRPSVAAELGAEQTYGLGLDRLAEFRARVVQSKLDLYELLAGLKRKGARVYGIGAPSRASTLVNYTGLDEGIVDCVLEVSSSRKLNKFLPGTLIPVIDEARLFEDQPEYALLLSWHIADELIANLSRKGYKGGYIIPLPDARIVEPTV